MAYESRSLLERISSRLDPMDRVKQWRGLQIGEIQSPDYGEAESPPLPQCAQELLLSDSDTEITPVEEYISNFKNLCIKSDQEKPRVSVEKLDSSDDDFENFLVKLKTPKPRASKFSGSQTGRVKDFIVDSDDDDFISFFPKNPKGSKKVTEPKSSHSDLLRVPHSNRITSTSGSSPVFVSDSDREDSVVIKSSWRDRTKGKNKNIKSDKDCKPATGSLGFGQSPPRSNKKVSAPSSKFSLDGKDAGRKSEEPIRKLYSSSSEEEFESLIERIKSRTKGQTPSSTVTKSVFNKPFVTEPIKAPCIDLTNIKENGKGHRSKSLTEAPSTPYFVPENINKANLQSVERPIYDGMKIPCKVADCFLQDLSCPKSQYVKCFKQKREELTARLYSLYNHTIFELKLPVNMEIIWNKKMRKTAGYCVTGQKKLPFLQRYARIELSEKVCDSADRLRDTLIHEICHAATWLINGVRDGHGQFWRLYARKATLSHPELPMVTRCHSYEINYKFTYECSRCKNTIGRHSKSLDTEKFVCALCKGKLVLLGSSRKDGSPSVSQLTPFAKFVKENYSSAKKELTGMRHVDVMRKLSADFATKAKITNEIS
uniref:SprT-like domain-containing protein n=1 Tax=Leptobrachium leishanense TaxID=445787 RepID=A0A8C5WJV6_9ANUR